MACLDSVGEDHLEIEVVVHGVILEEPLVQVVDFPEVLLGLHIHLVGFHGVG